MSLTSLKIFPLDVTTEAPKVSLPYLMSAVPSMPKQIISFIQNLNNSNI
nr:hypothetical protein [Candidatus Woesearchaeota archaeon]